VEEEVRELNPSPCGPSSRWNNESFRLISLFVTDLSASREPRDKVGTVLGIERAISEH
jgi:hypothetical protein